MRLLALGLAALALAAPALASQERPTLSELESEVICPTCKSTLDQSSSPIASRMRVFISARIAAGDSKGEIKDALVAEFGQAVLAAPPKKGFNLLAWLLPLALLAGGGIAVTLAARRWRVSASEAQGRVPPLDPKAEARLDDELRSFDA